MRNVEKLKINLVRNWWKFLLIFLVMILLSTSALITLITRNAIENSITNLRRSMPAVVTANFDESRWEEVSELMLDNPSMSSPHLSFLTFEQMQEIAELSYVRYYDYSIPHGVSTSEWLHANSPPSATLAPNEYSGFSMLGTSRSNVTFIESGDMVLTQGRIFNDTEMSGRIAIAPLLISEELSQRNNLSIGDTIQFEETFFHLPENLDPSMSIEEIYERYRRTSLTTETFEFKIIGFFTIEIDEDMSREDILIRNEMLNTLIAPNWRVSEMAVMSWESWSNVTYLFEEFYRSQGYHLVGNSESQYMIDRNEPFFVLYDILYFEEFEAVASSYLPDFWEFQTFFSTFEVIYRSFAPLLTFTNIGLIVVIGATIILMNLILILTFRDRKKEIGIYLALGEKKRNLLTLILAEIFIITSLSFILSFGIAHIIASEISHSLVRNELIQEDQDWQNFIPSQINMLRQRGFGRDISPEEWMETFDVGISFNIVVIFIGGGFTVIAISTVAPLMMLFEQKPKDLLYDSKIG